MIKKKQIAQRKALSNFSAPSLNPLLNQIYANRGIKSLTELEYSLKNLPRPDLLTGMNEACELLYEAALAEANILIVGDYDADGATSTALTKLVLQDFGFIHVAYFIPDRMTFGYGLSTQVVETIQAFQPDVIITVDNGISSFEGVKLAQDYGISVIITDHHLPADEQPQADAIINPNLANDQFPAKSLAGVGVAFYLMLGLRTYLRQQNWFAERDLSEPSMADYLDLVALGTIADVVPFDYVNRLLVYQGLQRIKQGHCKVGIKALLESSNCELSHVTSEDIAFKIAPKINAAGRLDDMSIGVECLLSQDHQSAQAYTERLIQINEQRKTEQESGNQQALELISDQVKNFDTKNKYSLCLYNQDWHPGIIGLIASRVKDSFNLPTVIFATDNDMLRGSARSISAVHIRDVIAAIDLKNPGLVEKFGGHAMAAGLTIKQEDFDVFQSDFEQAMQQQLSGKNLTAKMLSDGSLLDTHFELDLAELIQNAGPWGTSFDKPKFDNHFDVIKCEPIGQQGQHLRFKLKLTNPDSKIINAVAFNVDRYTNLPESKPATIHALYELGINRYNNSQNLQIIIDYYEVNSP